MTADLAQIGWVPDGDSFGARLALVRQRMGWWNLKAAADACGIPVQSWRQWERNLNTPRDYMGTVRAIVRITGVNEGWLATGVATQPVERARRDSNSQPSDP